MGTVASFTMIRARSPEQATKGSHAVVVVRLAEGLSLLGRMVDLPLDSLAVGLRVKFRPLVTGNQTVIGFGPAD
jgi:uncharacterized OB-fold protein